MGETAKRRLAIRILIAVALLVAVAVGVSTGFALAAVYGVPDVDNYSNQTAALPSQILDRDGELITEFFSEENREVVSIDELPRHLIYALITREDRYFFEHEGFSFQGTARAAWNLLSNNYVSGGSTLTQQLAGHLYADRNEFSVTRKMRELWWALQLERHWTKYEILERYLNTMFFGHGNYGVEAASQYYFGHSARDLTLAESAMLVIQLANPSLYSPIRRPNNARAMQERILDQMARNGYATQEEVESSFERYWDNYDFTRSNTSTAFFDRQDKAPYFSEYVRYELENELLLGSADINRDGFVVHTTLDLDFQEHARSFVQEGLTKANAVYRENTMERSDYENTLVPIIDLLSLTADIPQLYVGDAKRRQSAKSTYHDKLNPMVDMLSLMFATEENDQLRQASRRSYAVGQRESERTTVEGSLVTLENDTGRIRAMIGGSQYEARNQFNRATDARVEPGSSFKPLYYAAAIESEEITPATMLYDSPVVFWNDDGSPYTPLNYRGEWSGPVLARDALARSMNVPSLRILDRVGFDTALDIAGGLLGIPEENRPRRNLVRRYPVGLGIVEVAPIEMAKAFATLANQGEEVVPIGIRYIEDRDGRIILEPEKELREQQQQRGDETQIVSPQTAYIMTDILQTTVERGTLSHLPDNYFDDDFDQPVGGKTGTTQNWSDAWTIGFTPYYTTALWFGFDRGGSNSLGTNQTGAVTTGPVWGRYMNAIHKDLPREEFQRPADGLETVEVSERSGKLPTEDYDGSTREEIFISGTEPQDFDTMEDFEQEQRPILVDRLRRNIENQNYSLDSNPSDNVDRRLSSFDLELDLGDDELDDDQDDEAEDEEGEESTETRSDQQDGNPFLD
ncbi:MAG: penicillin-binding protein 1A [Spirochaetota bacterium]